MAAARSVRTVGAGVLLSLFLAACPSRSYRPVPTGPPPSIITAPPTTRPPLIAALVAVSGESPFDSCPRGGGFVADSEVEPSLAVDPVDPLHLVAAWQQDRNLRGAALGIATAWTADGGRTWRRSEPPALSTCEGGPYDAASDPIVSVGVDRAYVSALGVDVSGSGNDLQFHSDVVVGISEDGGATWGTPVVVASDPDPLVFFDKESVLADPRVPGSAYLVWVRYTSPSAREEARTNATMFSRTRDGGRTWSAPQVVRGAVAESQFHQLVAPGEDTLLDVAVEARSLSDRSPFPAQLTVSISTDGGTSWGAPVTAADITFTSPRDPTGKAAIRGTGQGILAAAAPDGTVYLAWSEQRLGAGSFVAVVRSDDRGRTWTEPVKVAQGTAQPIIPSVAVSVDGSVGVSWYQVAASGPGGPVPVSPSPSAVGSPSPLASVLPPLPTEVVLAWSVDRGGTWRREAVAGPFDLHTAKLTERGDFVGDYHGLVGLPGGFGVLAAVASPLARFGSTDVFFARVAAPRAP